MPTPSLPHTAQTPSILYQCLPALSSGDLPALRARLNACIDWEASASPQGGMVSASTPGRVTPNPGIYAPLDACRLLASNLPTILAHMQEDDCLEFPTLRGVPNLEYSSRPLKGVGGVVEKRGGGRGGGKGGVPPGIPPPSASSRRRRRSYCTSPPAWMPLMRSTGM